MTSACRSARESCSCLLLLLLTACGGGGPVETPRADLARSDLPAGPAWFEEVGAASGLEFRHTPGPERHWFPEIVGSGLGFLDYDGDGDLDLYAVQGGDLDKGPEDNPTNKLFRNDGERFVDVTADAGVGDAGYGMGVVVGDYDADGDQDLYVTNVGRNVLYRNEGDGTFTDATEEARLVDDGWGMSGVFLDADSDGDLDLFVVNYINWSSANEVDCVSKYGDPDYCEPVNYNAPAGDRFFLNNGDGTFRDETESYGFKTANGNGMGVAAGDFNADGRVDLYVANDGTPNQLWVNEGGRFRDASLLSGCAVNADGHAEASMGVTAVDADEDGDLDLFMTHLRNETNTLYLNRDGRFSDRTSRSGTASASLAFTGFGTAFADFDLDGTLDIYVGNGRVGLSPPYFDDEQRYVEPDQLFRGLGSGQFEEVGPRGGTEQLMLTNSRGVAVGDYDNDGDVDVAVLDSNGPLRLLRNVAARSAASLSLSVVEANASPAIGALVEVTSESRTRTRRVETGSGYLSAHDPRLILAVPEGELSEVRVRWTGGGEELFGPLGAGSHQLKRGSGR